jgi:hypothetical protein
MSRLSPCRSPRIRGVNFFSAEYDVVRICRFFLFFGVVALLGSRNLCPQPLQEQDALKPDAPSVARRALVLRAVYLLRLRPPTTILVPVVEEELEGERQRTIRWLRKEGLWNDATAWERRILGTPLSSLSAADNGRIFQVRESLISILLVLGAVDELPLPDGASARYRPRPGALPRPGQSTARFIQEARIRPSGVWVLQKELSEIWLLRAALEESSLQALFPSENELQSLREELANKLGEIGMEPRPTPDGRRFYRELIRYTAHWLHRKGVGKAPLDDDFPAFGRPYRDLAPKQKARLRSVARQRLEAFRWISGERSWGEDDE